MYIFKLIKYEAKLAYYQKRWSKAINRKNRAKPTSVKYKQYLNDAAYYGFLYDATTNIRNQLFDNIKTRQN